MPSDHVGDETVFHDPPGPPARMLWDVTPGVSVRIHGTYRRGDKAIAHLPLYYGPFARPQLWLMGLMREQKLELGRLLANAREWPGEGGVVADWLLDHEFPDWEGRCEPESDCEWAWEPTAYRRGEWRLCAIFGDDVVAVDRTFRIGDRVDYGDGSSGILSAIRTEEVKVIVTGPRGGVRSWGMNLYRFAEANKWRPIREGGG